MDQVCKMGKSWIRWGCPVVSNDCFKCDRCEWNTGLARCVNKTSVTASKVFDQQCVVDKLYEKLDADSDMELSVKDEVTSPRSLPRHLSPFATTFSPSKRPSLTPLTATQFIPGKLLANSYKLGSLKSQAIGSAPVSTPAEASRRRLAHIPILVADPNKNCEPCLGTYEGTPEAAPKVWCQKAGCVNFNVANAMYFCGNDEKLIVYKRSDCEYFWDPNNNFDDSNAAEEFIWTAATEYAGGYPLYKGTVASVQLKSCVLPEAVSTSESYDVQVTLTNPVAKPDDSIGTVFPHLKKFTWEGSRQGKDEANLVADVQGHAGTASTGTWNMAKIGLGPTQWGLTINQFKAFVDACKKEPLWAVIKAGSRKEGHIGYNKDKKVRVAEAEPPS